ncbi:zinc finger protein 518B isoform X1 [Alligator mississippiensis]|uniref:zinc finger protein 518B isoform X1 n=1 Tax=Alligator mississippiensis TaxID=8496 RepID=UPI0003D0EB6A|nr:zinc finger protein 518B isoform X1 [Alligator mississippiensis]
MWQQATSSEMQLKKMREILPKLYASPVNDKSNSLTTSPKKVTEDKTNLPKRNEGQNCYQGTEAEDKLTLVGCIKCRSVQKFSVHGLQKCDKLKRTEDRNFICNKCSPPTFNLVSDNVSATDLKKQGKPSSSKIQKTFKVKNFQPGKYYCDKCRFSTKDPLQYKKHVAQHEEIKFLCSHCNYVSYTKGEFQRHLVKHTGIFPYQCEYCEYGAIRHDYIVKHTRRVHEKITRSRRTNMAVKREQKRSCLPKQGTLPIKQRCDKKVLLPNEFSNLSSSAACGKIRTELAKTVSLSDDIKCNIDTASVQDKSLLGPAEVNIYENPNVEVEVYSPKKKPVQPGMPLTVIAPSELVVPSNCLAQLLEMKIVNGTQQLVLKLIPLEETTNKSMNCDEEELGNQDLEQIYKGNKNMSVAENKLLTTEANEDRLDHVANLLASDKCNKNSECLNLSSSHVLDCNSNMRREGKLRLTCDMVKDLRKGAEFKTGIPKLSIQSLVTNHSESSCPRSSNKLTDEKCVLSHDLHCYESLNTSIGLHAAASEDKTTQNVLLQASQEKKNSSCLVLGEKNMLPLNSNDKKCRTQFSSSPEICLFNDNNFVKEPLTSSEAGKKSPMGKTVSLEDLNVGLSSVKRVDSKGQMNNLLLESLELQKVENEDSCLEGPVISSVFSLSSGAENIPEGIRWDRNSRNKKSTALLCRKIAQLMSAAESHVKSTLAASPRPVRCHASNDKMPLPQETSANCEKNVLTTELEQSSSSLQALSKGVINNEECNIEQPLTTTKTPKSRVTKNSHVATPVFIPKGTVLRVLNTTSSKSPKEVENKDKTSPPSIYCKEMFLPRPVPFSISEKLSRNPPTLAKENELKEQSRNITLRSKREVQTKTSSKQNCMLLYQKNNNLIKQSKPNSKSQLAPKNKVKQAGSRDYISKKKTRIPSETSYSSEMTPLLTARRLRLVPLRVDQLIKCPRRNQPVVVLNHPDVDSLEVINVMKTINKYKGHVLKVVLSERTSSCLGVKRHHRRLTLQGVETLSQVKKPNMLKMKLKKTHKNNYQVVETSPAETLKCMFKCWFCGRIYVDQEEWISHGQRHLIEATKGWDVLSLPLKSHK